MKEWPEIKMGPGNAGGAQNDEAVIVPDVRQGGHQASPRG